MSLSERVLIDRDVLRQFLREILEVARSTAPELGRGRMTMGAALDHIARLASAALEEGLRTAPPIGDEAVNGFPVNRGDGPNDP